MQWMTFCYPRKDVDWRETLSNEKQPFPMVYLHQ